MGTSYKSDFKWFVLNMELRIVKGLLKWALSLLGPLSRFGDKLTLIPIDLDKLTLDNSKWFGQVNCNSKWFGQITCNSKWFGQIFCNSKWFGQINCNSKYLAKLSLIPSDLD